jgi:hypothetical protein
VDGLRRAVSTARFFGGPLLTRLVAPWAAPPTFSRDASAERRRGPDRLVLFDAEDASTAAHFADTWAPLDDVVMARCFASRVVSLHALLACSRC